MPGPCLLLQDDAARHCGPPALGGQPYLRLAQDDYSRRIGGPPGGPRDQLDLSPGGAPEEASPWPAIGLLCRQLPPLALGDAPELPRHSDHRGAVAIYPSFAPLGYRNVDGPNGERLIEPDSQLAPFVRRLFEWYATGRYSLMELTKKALAEGFRSRTAAGVPKSSIHKILTNPMYCGAFLWAGKYYRGVHEPIVSQDLFDRVQEMLDEKGRRRTRQQTHTWAFHGLLSCGHCGCALTAEIKKGRYIYYHCTGYKGRCPERYIREEEIAAQFGEALRAIHLDEEVLAWASTALRQSHQDTRRYHHEMIASLQKQYQRLQDRLDRM
jgi:site-specific DNA recombinase